MALSFFARSDSASNHRVCYRSAAVLLLGSVALTLLDIDAVIPLLVTAVAIVLMTRSECSAERGPMIVPGGMDAVRQRLQPCL
jgi:hypothetical protein